MIHLKNLSAAPQRLQRMLLRIQPYAITIRYRPGKEMAMADALSRQPSDNKEQIQLDVQLHFVQFSTQRLEILRDETQQDPELMELQSIILDGWPEKRNEIPAEIRKYWAFRDEMAVADGLVTKGDCVIIPKTLRRDILEKLHAAHQGIEKTRLRARTCVYWSGIKGDIEEMINTCSICQPRSCNVVQPSGGILRRNTERDAKPEKHVTFAPDRTYQTRSGSRRLEL